MVWSHIQFLWGINWIKFCQNSLRNQKIDTKLFNDYNRLYYNLEYHLLGNHLLENAFSLLFASYYFNYDLYYIKSKFLLEKLNEQILNDGAHYELSPMYHQIILFRILDSINLIKLNKKWKDDNLLSFVQKAL